MTNTQPRTPAQTILCPHCSRSFEGKLLVGPGAEPLGFKCPHCRLFVAADRAEGA